MSHWRKLFNSKYVGAWDFEGGPVTLTIKDVRHEEVPDQQGNKEKHPIVYFEKAKKGLVLNRTNAKTIAKLHGKDTDQWPGKQVTLFGTQCEAFGETVDCVRVKGA